MLARVRAGRTKSRFKRVNSLAPHRGRLRGGAAGGGTYMTAGCTVASVAPLGRPLPPLAARHGTAQGGTRRPPPPPQPYPPGPYRKSALKIDRNEVLYTCTGPLGPNVIFFVVYPLPRAQSSAQSSACMPLFRGALWMVAKHNTTKHNVAQETNIRDSASVNTNTKAYQIR